MATTTSREDRRAEEIRRLKDRLAAAVEGLKVIARFAHEGSCLGCVGQARETLDKIRRMP